MAEPGRDASQVEREPGSAGDHELTEHAVGQVVGPGRGAEQDGHDESELGHHGDGRRECARGAGRSVMGRIAQVIDRPDAIEDDRQAHGEQPR